MRHRVKPKLGTSQRQIQVEYVGKDVFINGKKCGYVTAGVRNYEYVMIDGKKYTFKNKPYAYGRMVSWFINYQKEQGSGTDEQTNAGVVSADH